MKNYYKILQIDKDASPEIIKVAYKLLVKKNHPDLKEGEEKASAEEKIKEINEAYSVLSDPSKKSEYDASLINESISQEQYNSVINENINLKKELNYFHNIYRANYTQRPYSNMYDNSRVNNNMYSNNKKNVINHTQKTNINLSEKKKSIIAICLTFLILFIMYQIPFIHDFVNLYLKSGYILFFLATVIFYLYFYKKK